MAQVVQVLCTPHDPTLPVWEKRRAQGSIDSSIEKVFAGYDRLRAALTAARPDVLVVAAGDHFGQWFMNNMPAFLLGKASRAAGPFPDEQMAWGLPPYDVPVEGELARYLLREGFEREIDFAYSDEFIIDHSFTIPLGYLRPEQDLPIVPLFLNVLAPPLATARRFYNVGVAVRRIIETWPSDLRVAIIATGHMSNSVGGPGMLEHRLAPETDWDRRVWPALISGNVEGVLAECSWEKMYAAGNGTPGFLGSVFALGAALGAQPSYAEFVPSMASPAMALLQWA